MKPTIEEKLQATEITEADIQPQGGQALTVTPMDMIQKALDTKADPAVLERLMALYERWQAEQNRLAFDNALRAFKANKPTILKTKAVFFDKNKQNPAFKHPTLDGALEQIDPALNKHGLVARWRPETLPDGRVQVTCILSGHGHREEYPLAGPPDTSGSKNSIQAIGSSVTYLQRYTLLPALGLAAEDDDDGKGAIQGDKPTLENVGEIVEFIANCRNRDELGKQFFPNYEKARTLCDKEAMQALIAAKRRKEAEWA